MDIKRNEKSTFGFPELALCLYYRSVGDRMIHSSDLQSDSLIVGCWQLDDRSWRSHSETDLERAVDTYLAMGVTCFDTADIYGRSEQLLGRLLKGRDCQVLTKAVYFGSAPTPLQIRNKVETSLRNLRRDHLDGLQIHWHNPQLDFAPTLAAFAELVEQGKIRNLGVTNFSTPMLEKAVNHAPIRFHQVQYSLIDRRVENLMQSFCLDHNIGMLAYGPLAGGFLSSRFRCLAHPKTEPDHARSFYYSSMIRAHGGWNLVQDLLETLAKVADKHQKTIAQVALNWVKHQPGVMAVISGLTLNREQIMHNVEALKWDLAEADLELLSARSAALFEQPGDIYSYERG